MKSKEKSMSQQQRWLAFVREIRIQHEKEMNALEKGCEIYKKKAKIYDSLIDKIDKHYQLDEHGEIIDEKVGLDDLGEEVLILLGYL